MKDEEMANESLIIYRKEPKWAGKIFMQDENTCYKDGFLAGLKVGRPQWHKVFESDPYNYEYWDLPQDKLPKIENFYFVKLKNGFIKICELKYDHWSGKKCFYDLHGGKQSNVAEWLGYPTMQKEVL